MNLNRAIAVFRTGTHTDAAGVSRTFTAEHLRAMADKFSPETGSAPAVKGHPQTDDPAYAWVDRFLFEETSGVLYAVFRDIDPEFADEVRSRRYARISLALHAPESPSNPVPGIYYPKHVGFLGAAAPAVTGLKAANFNQTGGVLMFDFNDENQVSKFSEILGKTLEAFGFRKPEANPAPAPAAPAPASVTESPEFKAAEERAAELQAQLESERQARQELEDNSTRAECAAFAEQLAGKGILTPVEAEKLAGVLFEIRDAGGELTFTEDGKETKAKAGQILRDFLAALPPRIQFGEISNQSSDGISAVAFQAPADAAVSGEARMQLHQRAVAYAAEHRVDYLTAVSTLERGSMQ